MVGPSAPPAESFQPDLASVAFKETRKRKIPKPSRPPPKRTATQDQENSPPLGWMVPPEAMIEDMAEQFTEIAPFSIEEAWDQLKKSGCKLYFQDEKKPSSLVYVEGAVTNFSAAPPWTSQPSGPPVPRPNRRPHSSLDALQASGTADRLIDFLVDFMSREKDRHAPALAPAT